MAVFLGFLLFLVLLLVVIIYGNFMEKTLGLIIIGPSVVIAGLIATRLIFGVELSDGIIALLAVIPIIMGITLGSLFPEKLDEDMEPMELDFGRKRSKTETTRHYDEKGRYIGESEREIIIEDED